jgi:hypothetical protein
MGWLDNLNAKRAEWRDAIAFMIKNPGQGPADDPRARNIHKAWMEGSARDLNQGRVNQSVIRALLHGLGYANEGVSGVVQLAGGKPFKSESGYDEGDIAANEEGISAGLAGPANPTHDMQGYLRARAGAGPGPAMMRGLGMR